MREKIGIAVLRSLESFEGDIERGWFYSGQKSAVKMTGGRLGRKGLARGWIRWLSTKK